MKTKNYSFGCNHVIVSTVPTPPEFFGIRSCFAIRFTFAHTSELKDDEMKTNIAELIPEATGSVVTSQKILYCSQKLAMILRPFNFEHIKLD